MHAAAIHSPTLRPSPLDPLRKHSPIPTLLTKPRKLSIAVASSLTTSAPKHEKDPKKRVVITGTGLVSIFGNDVDTYYLLLAGESGVGLIDRFDASKFPTRFAGQIHRFSSEGYIDGKNDRRLDDCLRYCIVAGKKTLEHPDLGGDKCSKGSVSLLDLIVGFHVGSPFPTVNASKKASQREKDTEERERERERETENVEVDFTNLTGRQKRLFELRLKMNEARKANQTAMVNEKKKMEAPNESRGISKQKWIEERKKKIGKLLDANGLDMSKAYMLDTQDAAEGKYKKWEKEPAPSGWDVFNQKTLYNAYKKRTKNITVDVEEYNRMKEADLEFYREASSLQYGKAQPISEDKIDRMVKELKDRDEKRQSFSRRRRFHEEKDIDSINDRNEHFNKKIERAFGKYTLEIKNNLERGTALPD